MTALCTDCHILGEEGRIGSGYTLQKCKNACLNDTTCLGIDFGKNGRDGECYFNYDQNEDFVDHADFDAWRKNSDCGM